MKSADAQKQPQASPSRSGQPFFGAQSEQTFFSKAKPAAKPFFNAGSPVQAKLTVGAVGDQYEQEADRVAEEVVNRIHSPLPEPNGDQQAVRRMGEEEEELQAKPLQRLEEEDELQMSPLAKSIQRIGEEEDELQMKPLQREAMEDGNLQMKPLVQREAMEEDELQMKPLVQLVGAEGGEVSADFENELNAARGGGQSLAPDLQAQMGQAMGADFSGVRVHTDGQADGLNRSVGARAFTTGQNLFFKQGEYQPGSRGGQELIAHELTHVVQQKKQQPTAFDTSLVQRNGGDQRRAPPARRRRRSRYENRLTEIARRIVPGIVESGRTKVLTYLANGLGKGGAHFWRSKEVRAFRAKLKAAARTQAKSDIIDIVEQQKDVFDEADLEAGSAMQDYIKVIAMDDAYATSKDVVDRTVQKIAEDWMKIKWKDDEIRDKASSIAKEAAWEKYKNSSEASSWNVAERNAKQATGKFVNREVKKYLDLAEKDKNSVLKPSQDQVAGADQEQSGIAEMVAQEASDSGLGMKSVTKAIKANTTSEGLGVVGKLLDQVIPLPGEQVALDISLKIPTGDGVSFVILKLAGKAGRGITGFSTSGVTTLGNPKRLEIMAQFSLGVGAETFGLKGDFSIGFFTRAGSDQGTAVTMKALSYGGYQAANGINSELANWWAGSGKGSNLTKEERAEKWAAAIEEQAFMESDDANPKNSFVDIGGSGGVSGGINVADVFSAEASLGGEVFKRYDADALEASLDSGARSLLFQDQRLFGQVVNSRSQARDRRKKAAGRTVKSLAFSASTGVEILGQSVSFAGSLSGEWDMENDLRDNWGVEISAEIEAGGDKLSHVEQWSAGIVSGTLGLIQSLSVLLTKEKAGARFDSLADATQILSTSAWENQITNGLADAWTVNGSELDAGIGNIGVPDPGAGIGTSSATQVAVTFGKSGGNFVLRFEVRSSRKVDVSVDLGSVGLAVSASKGRRILAIGYEDGGVAAEAIGHRVK